MNLKKLLLLFVVSFGLISCEDFPTISFSSEYENNFVINEATAKVFTGTRVIDPTTNEQFEKYKKKINSVEITKVTFKITSFNGPADQIANGQLDIADKNGGNKATLGSFSNVPLGTLLNQEVEIPVSDAAKTTLGNFLLKSPYGATVYYNGSVNKSPIIFNVTVKIYTKFTARVIGKND